MRLLPFALALVVACKGNASEETTRTPPETVARARDSITRDNVDHFFRDKEARGNSLTGKMLWSYAFTDHDRSKLQNLRVALEQRGYTFVSFSDPDPPNALFLNMEKPEILTASSLFARCQELAKLASSYDLESFDGFDVDNVDGSNLK